MITIHLMGGMGNQLFQYAYGRALSIYYKESLRINPYSMIYASLGAYHKFFFSYALKHFNIPADIRCSSCISGHISGAQKVLQYALYRKTDHGCHLHGAEGFHWMNQKGLFVTDDAFTYYSPFAEIPKKKNVIGYFANPLYFSEAKKVIQSELKIITPPSVINAKKIDEISQKNAVCVHIRRGDYVRDNRNVPLNVCNEQYYKQGMDYIASRVKDPAFYIFSNDTLEIELIKENYHFDYPVEYVDLNNPAYEELRLM